MGRAKDLTTMVSPSPHQSLYALSPCREEHLTSSIATIPLELFQAMHTRNTMSRDVAGFKPMFGLQDGISNLKSQINRLDTFRAANTDRNAKIIWNRALYISKTCCSDRECEPSWDFQVVSLPSLTSILSCFWNGVKLHWRLNNWMFWRLCILNLQRYIADCCSIPSLAMTIVCNWLRSSSILEVWLRNASLTTTSSTLTITTIKSFIAK